MQSRVDSIERRELPLILFYPACIEAQRLNPASWIALLGLTAADRNDIHTCAYTYAYSIMHACLVVRI